MEQIIKKVKEIKREIKEIRVFQLENELIDEVFKREWLSDCKISLYYDAKTVKNEEIEFLSLYKNIEINYLQ